MNQVNLPVTFNALTIEKPGAPVTLQQKTIGSLNNDEVLIRISYASINKMDPGLALTNGFNLPLPYVLGFDFSGEVVKLGGEAKDGLKEGDQVFGRISTGGCFAEYAVAKRESVIKRGNIPAPEASAFGIAYLTAYESLVVTGNIQQYKGRWIYVAGAAGGVGHFAAQIAKIYGLRVIGSAGKAASLELLQKLKIDKVIDYSKQDVVREIMGITGNKGADLVYDSTYAQSSYNQSTAVIASGGVYIRLGTEMQLNRYGVKDMRAVVEGRGAKMLIGDLGRYTMDPQYKSQVPKLTEALRQAGPWYEQGKLKPVITGTIKFDAAALQQAFDDFMKGKINVGKLVVKAG